MGVFFDDFFCGLAGFLGEEVWCFIYFLYPVMCFSVFSVP